MESQKYGKLKLVINHATKEVGVREYLTGKLMTDLIELLRNKPANNKKQELLDLLDQKSDNGKVEASVSVLKALMTGSAFAESDVQEKINATKFEFVRNCIEQSDVQKNKELQAKVYDFETKQVDAEAYEFWNNQNMTKITEVFEFFRNYIIKHAQ